MAVLGAASQGIYKAPVASVRNFPITFDSSGDIVYPQFAYPYRGWVISPQLSGVLSAAVPIAIILLAQIRIRSFWDANNAIMGVLYALILGTLFQVVIKQLIGGFRPYWLDVCKPDISRAAGHNTTGLNGVGYHQIMYTIDVCTETDEQSLIGAMTSFPSGHSTAALAGYGFLFLWMNAKLKVWANYQSSFYWLALLFAPLLGAVLICGSLTIDQAHNWYDILAGAAIGTATAFASYRNNYAAIWDWRFNHIPLVRGRPFDFAAGLTPKYAQRAVFARKNGWGRLRRGRRSDGTTEKRASRGMTSARSSDTYERRSGLNAQNPPVLNAPEAAGARGQTQNGRITGDDMV